MAKSELPDILGDVMDAKPDEDQDQVAARARMNYYLRPELIKRIKAYAKRRGLSASAIVTLAMEEYLSKHNA